jgi:hypothetical protein
MQETEENFSKFWAMEGAAPIFPKYYPTSALLGCVEILDCLKVGGVKEKPGSPSPPIPFPAHPAYCSAVGLLITYSTITTYVNASLIILPSTCGAFGLSRSFSKSFPKSVPSTLT